MTQWRHGWGCRLDRPACCFMLALRPQVDRVVLTDLWDVVTRAIEAH